MFAQIRSFMECNAISQTIQITKAKGQKTQANGKIWKTMTWETRKRAQKCSVTHAARLRKE